MKKEAKNKEVKKKMRRSNVKYPGLDILCHPRIRREYLDQDYIHKLNDEDKKWLSDFSEEWLGANFKHPGELIQKTDEERKECYRRNSRRNRDITSIGNATGRIDSYENLKYDIESKYANHNGFEELMIAYLDAVYFDK